MELLNENEIHRIIEQFGYTKVVSWAIKKYSDQLIGYLGDHLTLTINAGSGLLKLFVKCKPRTDPWKAKYIEELTFFRKEYYMLSRVFKNFKQGEHQWRPNLLLIREDLFVFEDVTELGYKMPSNREILTLDELKACVVTMANFHAQSIIYEENRSKELNRPYRLWEEYSDYLKEPAKGVNWRNAGRNAVIDFLKVYSKEKSNPKFVRNVDSVITALYDKAVSLMQPSSEYRNTIIHRDLWSNNIFLRKNNDGITHALFVDFQTVLYCSPMLDLSSLIYFNTSRPLRESRIREILDLYYEVLAIKLGAFNFDINVIFDRKSLDKSYEESIVFGLTQAAIIIPITAMDALSRELIFCDPEISVRINEVTRSNEFINIAKSDAIYRNRVNDILDEIVDRYICPSKVDIV